MKPSDLVMNYFYQAQDSKEPLKYLGIYRKGFRFKNIINGKYVHFNSSELKLIERSDFKEVK